MKNLKALLTAAGIPISNVLADSLEISGVTADSRLVKPGFLFVAIPGVRTNGRVFIHTAMQAGAVTIVVENAGLNADTPSSIPTVSVPNARLAYANLISAWHDFPSKKLKLIGVTGTNGKTTTAFLTQYLLNSMHPTGLIGTVHFDDGVTIVNASHTTPSPEILNDVFCRMLANELRYCAMEVSSHALDQERVSGLDFETAIFMNLTQDHLDYHHDFETYYAAKRKLFIGPNPPKRAIVNIDDPFGARLISDIKTGNVISFGMKPTNRSPHCHIQNIQMDWNKLQFELVYEAKTFSVHVPLALRHNVYNVTAAFLASYHEGIAPDVLCQRLATFPGVCGRMERIVCGQKFNVFVDYAHTPDALLNILTAAQELSHGRIISVFGAGGDRDRGKRPQMGKIASRLSDVVIVTSDNPRSEDPMVIAQEIEAGISPVSHRAEVMTIIDRKMAIQKALKMAEKEDVIFVFGKGHEDYQVIGTEKKHFSDQELIRDYLTQNADY